MKRDCSSLSSPSADCATGASASALLRPIPEQKNAVCARRLLEAQAPLHAYSGGEVRRLSSEEQSEEQRAGQERARGPPGRGQPRGFAGVGWATQR